MKSVVILTSPVPELLTLIPFPPVTDAADMLMTPELPGNAETKIGTDNYILFVVVRKGHSQILVLS